MKKVIAIILSVLMIFTVWGSLVYAEDETLIKYNVTDIMNQIKKLGRASESSNGIALDWTASGIEFTADCSGNVALEISASCTSPVSGANESDKDCYYTVYIDGVRQDNRLRVMSGVVTVNIAENLQQGTHTFKIIKQTEAVNAKTEIRAISLNGTIGEKPADSKYIVEAIGDSITSGHSSTAIGIGDSQRSRFSDGTRTYAYLTAENFGAEARVISQSGGTMSSLYNNYQKERFGDSVGTFDFSKYQKPNVVIIGLATNDGAKTYDYWYEWFNKYITLIREGYNDDSIPFIWTYDHITNPDSLRLNATKALNTIRKEQEEKAKIDGKTYGGLYYVTGGFAGGHPRQDRHLTAAKKMTQLIINEGIIPASELKSDATVKVTATNVKTQSFNKFDSSLAVPSGVTYEKVAPLDPNDAGNDSASAAKYTADGTQAETTVSLGSISSNDFANFRVKGFSFYINYKNKAEDDTSVNACLTVKSTDQTSDLNIEIQNSVTQKVEVTWEELKYVNANIYRRILEQRSAPSFSLKFKTGEYEVTLDNIELLVNDYTVADNADRSYKVITEQLPLIGITDNFESGSTSSSSTSGSSSTDYLEVSDVSSKDNWITGEYDYQNGQYRNTVSRACVKNLIKIDTSKSYKFATNNSNTAYQFIIREYNSNGGFIKSIGAWTNANEAYKPTTGTSYISLSIFDAGGSTLKMIDLITNATISPSMTVVNNEPSVTDPSEPSSSETVPAGEAVAKIGETEYSSLFGANGAIAKAVDGDRIVMVADEEYQFNPGGTGWILSEISNNIVLDLAGHTVNVTRSNSNRGELFKNDVPFEIASTVDGLGETNTVKKGVIKGVATIVNASADFKASNVELRSSLTDDTFGAAIKSGAAGKTVTLRDAVLYAPKMALFANGGKINIDCDNSTIYATYYAIRLLFSGTFKNSTIYTTNNYTCEISGDNLLFDNCNIYVGQYDQYALSVTAGDVTLANGTVVDGKGKAGNVVKLTGTAKLITDNAKIFNAKNTAGKYALNIASTASAELGDAIITSPSNATPSNVNLYKYLKTGKVIYTTDVPSADTLVPEDYAVADYKTLYIRDAIKSNTVTIDGAEVSYTGNEFTFPQTSDVYVGEGTVYTAGETITVDKDLSFDSYKLDVKMKEGASIRLNITNGIRFSTNVNISEAERLAGVEGVSVSYGTLITPKDLMGENELTLDSSFAKINVDYKAALGQKHNTNGFVGSIVNINESNSYNAVSGNLTRDFVGRGYVKVTVGETTKTVYAADYLNNARSVAYVAYKLRNDSSDSAQSLYLANKEVVDKWSRFYEG